MPNPKVGSEMNRYFSVDEVQLTNRHMKNYSMSLVIQEIKTMFRFHTPQKGRVSSKNEPKTSAGGAVG